MTTRQVRIIVFIVVATISICWGLFWLNLFIKAFSCNCK